MQLPTIERLSARLRSRRGNIMVHVLVTSIIVMVIATGLMRLVMMRYIATERMNDGGRNKRLAEAALAATAGRWNAAGASCTTAPPNFTLSGSGCACTLTGSGPMATVVVTATAGVGTACRLSVVAGS